MATVSDALAETAEDILVTREPLTPTQLAWRRFRRHKMAMFGLFLLVLLIVYAVGGAFVFTEAYANTTDRTLTGGSLSAPALPLYRRCSGARPGR